MSYIQFIEVPPSGKTKRWEIRSIANHAILGWISWYSPWRRYCFTSAPGTIFDSNCLDEITTFLDIEMEKHKR